MSIFEDLKEVVAGMGAEGLQTPVVEDEQLGGAECLEAAADTAVAMGERQFVEECQFAPNVGSLFAANVSPLTLAFAVARRRSAEPLAERSA